MTFCTWCGDEANPVEYNPPSIDADEPWFCSHLCQEAHQESVDADLTAYREARYTGATVY